VTTDEWLMLAVAVLALVGIVAWLPRLLDGWLYHRSDPDRTARTFLSGRWWQ
jgi:hypothetical protein